jgi:hypothetical protein
VVVLGEGVLRLLRIVAGQEGAGWPGTLVLQSLFFGL